MQQKYYSGMNSANITRDLMGKYRELCAGAIICASCCRCGNYFFINAEKYCHRDFMLLLILSTWRNYLRQESQIYASSRRQFANKNLISLVKQSICLGKFLPRQTSIIYAVARSAILGRTGALYSLGLLIFLMMKSTYNRIWTTYERGSIQ